MLKVRANAPKPRGARAAESAPAADADSCSAVEDLLTRVAWLYYKGKLTQQQIAEVTYISRQKVQRLLERARDLEIVKFDIKHPSRNLLSVEDELRRACDLRDAVVVPSQPDGESTSRAFSMAGAAYLERILGGRDSCTLGLGWGNTTAHLADYFEPTSAAAAKIRIVSLIGNLMTNVVMNPYIMGMKIAEKLGAPFYNIWAPAIAHTKARAESFRSEPWIRETLDIAAAADIKLLSIGELSRSATLFKMGYLSEAELARLRKKRAVGDLLCRFFDVDGTVVDDAVHDRVVAVPLDTLRDRRTTVIAVAGGSGKIDAIAGAIRGGFVDVLVTDELSARALIEKCMTKRDGA